MKTREELARAVKKYLKPVKKLKVSDWADEYRKLSVGVSAEPGKWKTSSSEYTREVMNAFSESKTRRVTMMSSAQVGKSEVILNVIGRYVHLDPCPIMLIEPTEELMKDVSKSRISAMIRESDVLRNLFYEKKESSSSRDSEQTILIKQFPGGRLVMCGANSPTNLASRSIKILLCDEVDRFPPSAGSEGDPIEIAAKRTTTYWDSKIGLFSTPTIKGESRIEDEYLNGSQEEWSHQCPNCKEYHVLDHKDMVVDYEENLDKRKRKQIKIKSVKWRCPDCGYEFDERTMKQAHQKYIMKNENGYLKGNRSFFVNGFASRWVRWTDIYEEYYKAQGQPKKEQVVWNTRFGKSYEYIYQQQSERIDIDERLEEYEYEVPEEVKYLTAGVDVQDNRLEVEICGWDEEGKGYGINRYKIHGRGNEESTWLKLDEILDKEYEQGAKRIKIQRTFIDSGGHYTSEVYRYCRKNLYKQRIAIKGYGGYGAILLYKTTVLNKFGIMLQIIGVNEGKDEVMSRYYTKGIFKYPKGRNYDEEYFKQMEAEEKVQKIRQGMRISVWEPKRRGIRNEALDMRVYNFACYKSLQSQSKVKKKNLAMTDIDVWR